MRFDRFSAVTEPDSAISCIAVYLVNPSCGVTATWVSWSTSRFVSFIFFPACMKPFLLLTILLVLLRGMAWAQGPAFDHASLQANASFGGIGNDLYGGRTTPDAQGITYEAGYYSGTATFGLLTLTSVTNYREVFVARRDAAGAYQWVVRAGGSHQLRLDGVTVDANGAVYIAGSFDGNTATFGAFTVTNAHASIPNSYDRPDIFVAKLSAAGTWLWANRGGGGSLTGSSDLATGVVVDAVGNAYVCGTFDGRTAQFGTTVLANPYNGNISDVTEVFVAKLDASGSWQWAVHGGSLGNDGESKMAFDNHGNLVISGYSFGNGITFGAFSSNNPTGGTFVAKLTPAGTWLWAATSSGNTNMGYLYSFRPAVIDANDNLYVTGSFTSATAVFGATTLTNVGGPRPSTSYAGPSDLFVAKLDATGAWQWAVRAGGTGYDSNYGMVIDAAGSVYMTGSFSSPTADFGTTTLFNGSTPHVSNGVQYFPGDVYVAKVSATGTFQWAVSAGGDGNDYGSTVTVDRSGCLGITGYFDGPTARFGTFTLVNSAGANGGAVPFGARLGCRPLATATDSRAESFTLYPNPNHTGGATLVWSLAPTHQASRLLVYSLLGRVVWENLLPTATAGTVSITGLAAGIYLARLFGPDGVILGNTQRLVVE